MGIGFYLSVGMLPVMLIIATIYFKKEKINNEETEIYKYILLAAIVMTIFEICSAILYKYFFEMFIYNFTAKMVLISYIVMNFLFCNYLMRVCKNSKIRFNILYIITIITVFLIIINTTKYIEINGAIAPTGIPVILTYVYAICLGLYQLFLTIKNRKTIIAKKFTPFYLFLLFGLINTLIIYFYSTSFMVGYIWCLTIIVMYFTIENPDLQMVKELYKNKKIIDSSNQSIGNLLFKISQDIKYPVNRIVDLSDNINLETVKEIHNLGKHLQYVVDDTLDVSSMTTKDLKIYNTNYNPKNLFDSLKYRIEADKKDNIKFEYYISKDLPDYVYGDSLKLKHILSSILKNSLDHTETGFISLEVNTINKYGICRFIIDIEDSSPGISIDKINEILSLNEKEEQFNFDNPQLRLKEIKAMVSKIGGSFMIKSEEGKGTIVSITLDQKIVELNKKELAKRMELYESSLYNNTKAIVIDDDVDELSFITNYMEEKNVNVEGSLFGKDLLEKIRNKAKYNLIILDDETNTGSALSILQELKKDPQFKTPVVVIIDKQKEFIKLHYLQDGFADVILKSNLKYDLDRVLKRFHNY